MPESGTFGSVRGVRGNAHPYRNPRPIADPWTSRKGSFKERRRRGGWLAQTSPSSGCAALPSGSGGRRMPVCKQ